VLQAHDLLHLSLPLALLQIVALIVHLAYPRALHAPFESDPVPSDKK
jgi:hypothetical protein